MRTILALLLPSLAFAQVTTKASFQLQLFEPELGEGHMITTPGPNVLRHLQFDVGTYLHYGRKPLEISANDVDTGFVDQQTMVDVLAFVGVLNRAEFGLSVPLALSQSGPYFDALESVPNEDITKTGLGDMRLYGKVRLWGTGRGPGVAFAPVVTLPTGNNAASGAGSKKNFTGEKGPTVRPRIVGGWRDDRIAASGYLGYLVRKNTDYLATASDSIVVGDQILYGGGGVYRLGEKVEAMGELFGRLGAADPRVLDASPAELDVAVRVEPSPRSATGLFLTAGGGAGVHKGIGSPQVRGFFGISWSPDFTDTDHDGIYDRFDHCPEQAEDRDGFEDEDGCPDPDNDQDLIPDVKDKCPNLAEDRDGFEDDDGCPDPDNDKDGIPDIQDECPFVAGDGAHKGCTAETYDSDGDGIPDAKDKCPNEAEDPDGFQDDDGCPDPDNDADGIPDNFDDCPDQAEDVDGFKDEDGCPDPDNDADGTPDAQDKCPNIPGPKNKSGCP
jgi:OmpA-OmpF porin, OOP family